MKKDWTRALFVAAASAAALLFGAPALAEAPEPEEDAEALLALEDAEDSDEIAETGQPLNAFNRRLRNVGTGLCLSTSGSEPIARYTNCSVAPTHRWDIIQLANGLHIIRSRNPQQLGRCLTVAGETIRPGSIAFMGPCGAPGARRWRMATAAPRRMYIANHSPLLCLHGGAAGTPARVQLVGAGVNQLWQDLP
ncbi:RICIN domain-containing protein [Polyangium spumosum]|uniref:Uncharacterized protein n=1 Tax=Polyangium spumosum TaxID=889282 RepID=A0A6N7PXD0_9BACT|nr:RICIN domain-containing protein [Polyangium spumosum]MRG96177.1 hypothetical protein [Polyangium spumosum]